MDTSWQSSSRWYKQIVGNQGHYFHQNIIIPKLLNLLQLKLTDNLIDLGCGQGILERYIDKNIQYTGIDLSSDLIVTARHQSKSKKHQFIIGDITKKINLKNSFTKAAIVLAFQNVDNPDLLIKNTSDLLIKNGKLFIVLNHPCFRIPRLSSWGVDQAKKLQYRRLDSYLSSQKIPISTNPHLGNKSKVTWSFHLPISTISQILFDYGFTIELIEEWISDKKSLGKIAIMEDRARREFPLFMTIVARKN